MLSGTIDVPYLLIVLVVILLSMTLHEAMHGFMAYWLGDDTARREGRLTLNPIRHIDPFLTILLPLMLAVVGGPIFGGAKPVPFNPARVRYEEWGAALVAIAGPLTNFILAFLCFGIWVFLGQPHESFVAQVVSIGIIVNLGFFIFNILPIPPLDGSRVLYALAPEFVRRGMEIVEQYGLVLVFILVLFAGSMLGTYMTGALDFFLDLFAHVFGLSSGTGV